MLRLQKYIIGILILILTVSVVSCSSPESSTDNQFKNTNIVLSEKGSTDYKIIIPATPLQHEQLAADETKLFFEQSTGAKIEITDDSDVTFSESDKVISIGNTTVLAQAGLSAPSDVGYSGYSLKIKGNSLFIVGETEFGSLYGAYDFLEYNLGVKFYGYGENLVPENKGKVFLKDFDYSYRPAFDIRCLGNPQIRTMYDGSGEPGGGMTQHRFRLTETKNYLYGFGAHTTMMLVPSNSPSSFYASDKQEICFTNENVMNAAVNTIIARRNTYENTMTESVMIGAMDNTSWCSCPTCSKEYGLYSQSGVYIRFVNELARRMKEWELENNRKQLTYVAFAYRKTEPAPTVYSSETGVYTARHESVIPADNVAIRIAPLYATLNRNLLDIQYNAATKAMLDSWGSLTENFYVWTYGINYYNMPIWFNDFYSFKENYQIFRDIGAVDIFDQFTYNVVTPAFSNLKGYVKSKLMWNLDLDPEVLAYDFIDNYYKESASQIKKLFDAVNRRYNEIDKAILEKNGTMGLQSKVQAIYEPEQLSVFYWPYDFVQECQRYIDNALAEASKITDSALRATIRERIRMEEISVQYIALELYRDKYTASQYQKLIDEFERNCNITGVNATTENVSESSISIKVAEYKDKI